MAYDNKYVIQKMMKIRNKLVAVLCAMSCVMCLMGCGGTEGDSSKKDNESTEHSDSIGDVQDSEKGEDMSDIGDNEEEKLDISLTLNGVKYDLMGNFNETVGKMVQDGLIVGCGTTDYSFCNNGFALQEYNYSHEDLSHYVIAQQHEMPSLSPIFRYTVPGIYSNVEYETIHNITNISTEDDIKDLDGITNYRGLDGNNIYIYLYMDNQQVDISSYEQDTKKIVEDSEAYREFKKYNMYLPEHFKIVGEVSGMMSFLDSSSEEYIKCNELFVAMVDVSESVNNGEAETMTLISYYFHHDTMDVIYELYGLDFVPKSEWENYE